MSNRSLRATTASRSSEPIFTPSSTTASFGAGLQETPFSFAFPSQVALNNETTTMDSNSQPGTPRYTPSSSSALLGLGRDHTTMPSRTSDRTTPETRVLTPSSDGSLASPGNDDPDRPLQSVERVALSTTTPQSIQGESSRNALSDENRPSNASDIPGLAGLRLASPTVPAGSPVPRGTSTPSILVHPSPPPNHSREVRASRTDSLTHAITALHMNSSSRVGSPASQGLGESESPSPARRRRSGSRMGRESHRIEDEIPPEGLFYTREVQEALVNARTLTSRMANVLSSSNLHLEDESRVQGLYQQAQALNAFQLPSTRIVGLVGDSGVGKSSLINSLLDKVELARAVSNRHAS